MGLITQEIEITLNNKYVSYYKNLGYEIPQHKRLTRHKPSRSKS